MRNEKIHLERIKRFIQRQKDGIYTMLEPLATVYISSDAPIPYAALRQAVWQPIEPGTAWGEVWGSAWFKVSGRLSTQYPAADQGLYFDCEGEACVMTEGTPYQGLTPKVDWYHNAAKHYVPLAGFADDSGAFELYIEAAANDLFGAGKQQYHLSISSLCMMDEERYQFSLDLDLLLDLANSLPEKSVRRARIIYGLNEICNVYAPDPGAAKAIAQKLLRNPACPSALKAYSVGHAHLDLAWLWPMRESRRKGGRTFANALRLLDLYPDYIFGASQAQLYSWIKQDYPALYEEVKAAVKSGRWEVQGASWVEFDTNLPSAESLIRQFVYGRDFFDSEFGIVPNCLWLPDCFGFSGNLPQIMKGCNVDYFVTQKLSWNESNTFDQHLFIWQGIDGSEVRAHQLPTNDYNFSNNPSAFRQTEARFAQAEIAESYLNLFGIGDGGGGPTRNHIEYGLRQRDLEGSSRFIFSKAEDFFAEYALIPAHILPRCYTELYLEFHRGTYTTQAVMKQDNFFSERLLHAAEWMAALANLHSGKHEYPQQLHLIWKDTLLLQFHDILPGSSITKVYEDAHAVSSANHARLRAFIQEQAAAEPTPESYTIFNPSPTPVDQWLSFPIRYREAAAVLNHCEISQVLHDDDAMQILVHMEPYSKARLDFMAELSPMLQEREEILPCSGVYHLKSNTLNVKVSNTGSIISIKSEGQEFLSSESNLLQLWEDEPNNWGAWDINHFYKETTPQSVEHAEVVEAFRIGDYHRIVHKLKIGQSRITQTLELLPGARHILIHHDVDWQERHKMLRVAFQSDILSQEVECGIQMGKINRSARAKNAWDAARFDFPAQGYVAQSEAERTCAILAAAKYGFSARENVLELALLRSPADVDPTADLGHQSYTYGFFSAECSFADAHLAELAQSLDAELICVQGSSPLQIPMLHLQYGLLQIATIKPASDGKAIILRLYEPVGRHCRESIYCDLPLKAIYKCNMLEEPLCEISQLQEFEAKPFEIVTLRLELSNDSPAT